MLDWLFTPEHRERRKKAAQERKDRAEGVFSRETAKPKDKDRPKPAPFWSSNSTISINNDVIIVNGKKLKPGTPEYEKYKAKGMRGLARGMSTLDEAMKGLDDLFKDL